MDVIKPNKYYLDRYLAACKEPYVLKYFQISVGGETLNGIQ